jgi:hypothetical protein
VGLAAVGGLANVARAHADPSRPTFVRTRSQVSIAGFGHVDLRDPSLSFDFFADIDFGARRPASGGMQVALADGSVRSYEPVAGMLLEGNECLVFFLNRLPSGELEPTEQAIAVVREDPQRRVIVLKLQLRQLFPDTLHFEVPGDIRLMPASGRQPQAQQWFSVYYWSQRVTFDGTDTVARFSAWARVRRDGRANGFMALGPLDGQRPSRFEPLLATAVPETETGPSYIVILMAMEGAPLEIENLAIATVHADPDVPGCDIWDFTSNVPTRRSVFHAQGKLRFAHARRTQGGP